MIRMDLVLAMALVIGLALVTINFDKESDPKMNGASLVSPRQPIPIEKFEVLNEIGVNWVAVIPYAFTPGNVGQVIYNHDRQWWGEKTDGVCELIRYAHQKEMQVMLKPHIWVRGQGWAGDFELANEEEWTAWESQYEAYILHFAHIADSLNVGMLCIGTELRKSVVSRPDFWISLIEKVRRVYSGRLTYAANWDNYHNVTFWDQLDYIGVDAYFPVDTTQEPQISQLIQGWEPTRLDLKKLSSKYDRPILFTEFGYQSITGTAGNHWELDQSQLNLEAQANAYEAFYEVFWDQNWVAGGFFWKWHFSDSAGGRNDPDFTPQGKPAQEVIHAYYSE